MSVRHPAVAGMFYPKESGELASFVRFAVDSSPNFKIKPKIIISPHAGYIYSGYTAGYAYRQLENLDRNRKYKVLIIGPSHRVYLDSAAFSPDSYFETPLGEVEVDKIESERIAKKIGATIVSEIPHRLEHSLEVQLPFLQTILHSFSIVPVVYGDVSEELLVDILEEFLLDDSRIVVVSSDLSHYYPYKEAVAIDSYCIAGVEKLDEEMVRVCQACGKPAIIAAIRYALKHNLKSKTLDYRTSGDTAGDKDSVVGYGSFMFYKEGQ